MTKKKGNEEKLEELKTFLSFYLLHRQRQKNKANYTINVCRVLPVCVWLWELENVPQHFLCSSSLQLWRMQLWLFSCWFLSLLAPSIVFPLFSLPNSLLYLTHSSLVHDGVENDEKRIVAVPVGWIENNTLVEQAGKNGKKLQWRTEWMGTNEEWDGEKSTRKWIKRQTRCMCARQEGERQKLEGEITYTNAREEKSWLGNNDRNVCWSWIKERREERDG